MTAFDKAWIEQSRAALERGAVDLIDRGELSGKLARAARERRGLRVKFGMDPSSPDLHVGHGIHLRKLRELQDLGHTVVLIVGDATAMVGDPSGRNKLRPQLSRAEVEENLVTYREQAGLVLDLLRVELRHNSEWFDRMTFEEVLRLCGRMTVAQMLQRDTFQERVKADQPIGIHEFLYPLMQGWDSVMVRADVEFGGTDQLFNLLVGRDLQESAGQDRQVICTAPLINGLDGRKMSKSYGNAIGLTDPPHEMFGKAMSIEDGAMPLWLVQLTRLPADEIARLLAGHPRAAKARLAQELTAFYHGPEAAAEAARAFDRLFKDKAVPEDVPLVRFGGAWPAQGVPLSVLLREVGLAESGSKARQAIEQGGVRVGGEVVRDAQALIPPPGDGESLLVQVGKRRFARVLRG